MDSINSIVDDLNCSVYNFRMLQILTIDETTYLHQKSIKSVSIRNIAFFLGHYIPHIALIKFKHYIP